MHAAPLEAVVISSGRVLEARVPLPPSPLGSLSVSSRTRPGFPCFSVALVTKKHRYFPGICDAAGDKAATSPIPGLCFQRNSMFLYSLTKFAAYAVLKLMSAVIAIAHVQFVGIKPLSVKIMLLEYSFGKLKFDSSIRPMSGLSGSSPISASRSPVCLSCYS